jgi:hypothetical protein
MRKAKGQGSDATGAKATGTLGTMKRSESGNAGGFTGRGSERNLDCGFPNQDFLETEPALSDARVSIC